MCQHCGGQGVTTIQQGNMIFQTTCNQCGGSGQKIINGCKKIEDDGELSLKLDKN